MSQQNTDAKPLRITDTTLRDAHQSLAATRMRTQDMEPIVEAMAKVGFHSMEVWGGATFDVATRFLFEDPWERVRILKKLVPNTPLQMLLRGQNLVGYRNYADDVVNAFVAHSAETGIDVFRIFDALNDERNLETATKAVRAAGKHAQLCICYSVTEEGHLGGKVFTLDYFLAKARAMEAMGADSICIKDMAGLLSPYDAFTLVSALKKQIKVPIQLHNHYTSGLASMTALKAAEAGLDVVDACLSPLALRTSQPAVEPLVVTMRGTPRDTGLDLAQLAHLGEYFETLAPYLRGHMTDSRLAVVDTQVLSHQVPGGMISNLMSQLREAEALDRLPEVLEELPLTRQELGYPPLVTPTSQIVGVQAVNNVLFGRWNVISSQVRDYCYGLYGTPPLEVSPEVSKRALEGYEGGTTPITGRAADSLKPEMKQAEEATKGLAKDIGDVLIYALYPVTGEKFLRVKHGLEKAPEVTAPPVAAAPPPTDAPPLSGRARNFNVTVSGRYFQVTVDPQSGGAAPAPAVGVAPSGVRPQPGAAAPAAAAQPGAAALAEGEAAVTAPMPGLVMRYTVEVGQAVKAGETVVVLEAMKMENALPSPADGVVKKLPFKAGDRVARGEALVVIGAA